MEPKWYVQHISGQGEKWEVNEKFKSDPSWSVFAEPDKGLGYRDLYYLPKSEYRLCDPPEQWEDVTADCSVVLENYKVWKINCGHSSLFSDHYQIRKELVQRKGKAGTCYAFIVERKVS